MGPTDKPSAFEVYQTIVSRFSMHGISFNSPPQTWVNDMEIYPGLDISTKKQTLEYVLSQHKKTIEEHKKLIEEFEKYLEVFGKGDTTHGITCQGCLEDQPNQLAHMGPGGCIEEDEEDYDF